LKQKEIRDGSEKRLLQRLKADIEAYCISGSLCIPIDIKDISSQGIGFEILKQLPIEREIEILLIPEPDLKVRAKAELRWSIRNGLKWIYGAKFTSMSREDASALRNMVHNIFWENFNG